MSMHETPDLGNTERIEEALRHVEMGFAAFSVWSTLDTGVCKCLKGGPCESPGKHPIPPNGFLAASTDPDVVRTMLSAASNPNYGIVWPESDRIVVVLDVDGEDWKQRVDDLIARYGPLPPTKTTRTPSGGLHLFYEWPNGVPLPKTNHLHGFVARFPMKGYVVGPGSRINGKVYKAIGPRDMATLPVAWAKGGSEVGGSSRGVPLITVTGEHEGYALPDSVPTGTRHDAIAAYVASRWNRGLSLAEIDASVRAVLCPLFDSPMEEPRLTEEIRHAYETCAKKWVEPAADGDGEVTVRVTAPAAEGQSTPSGAVEEIVIDPLDIEMRIERPAQPDLMPLMPLTLDYLVSHLMTVTDAPATSLTLASLVTMSALVGRNPSLRWRGTHRCQLFGALVGDSHYGRKSAAINEALAAFAQVDPLLPEVRERGIASGEAFIDTLSDAAKAKLPVLVVETELGGMLATAAREGNTVSFVVREAWDGAPISTRSRKSGRVSARDYHVSMLGGTTPSDLERYLTNNDVANGWANRWLWFWAEKRQDGYDATRENDVPPFIIDLLRESIEYARKLGGSSLIAPASTMSLAPDGKAYLDEVVASLDFPAAGTINVLRQRMPNIALRIAMLAAILDLRNDVTEKHLRFGFAMTDYAVESMRAVFGLRVDDPLSMFIIEVLRQVPDGWMNTTDLKKVTGKEYARVQSALRVLLASGVLVREERASGNGRGGRPSVGYRLAVGSG